MEKGRFLTAIFCTFVLTSVFLFMFEIMIHFVQSREYDYNKEVKKINSSLSDTSFISTPIVVTYDSDIIRPNSTYTNMDMQLKDAISSIYKGISSEANISIVADFKQEDMKNIGQSYLIFGVDSRYLLSNFNISATLNGRELFLAQDVDFSGMNFIKSDSSKLDQTMGYVVFLIPDSNFANVDYKFDIKLKVKNFPEFSLLLTGLSNTYEVKGNILKGKKFTFCYKEPTTEALVDNSFYYTWLVTSNKKEEYTSNIKFSIEDKNNIYEDIQDVGVYSKILYSILCLIFFMLMLDKGRKMYVLYIFVSLSILVFYALLLSLSEYIGFIFAYILSVILVSIPVARYMQIFLDNKLYGYVSFLGSIIAYLIILLMLYVEDYITIIVAVILTLILYCLMFFARKMNVLMASGSEDSKKD